MFTQTPPVSRRAETRPARPGLLRQAAGLVEAALTPHGVDSYVELIAPTWSSREVRARITEARRTTPGSVTLTLRPNRTWAGFTAGQHTQLTVEIDGVRHTRCYSLVGSQHDRSGTIELTVKAHPEGLVSQHLVTRARRGMVVGLTAAQGEFTLPEARPEHTLLISGGSGITPVLSMLRTLCDEGHDHPVTFLHYSLTAGAMPYRNELALLAASHPNVRVVRVFTDEPGTGDLPAELGAFLTPEQLDAADPGWRDAEAYVCGPAPLMGAAVEAFTVAGRAEHVHTEAFTLPGFAGARPAGDTAVAGGSVRFAASDLEVTDDGRPILLQAEDAGLRPQSGCRMGICHTCTRHLHSGAVRNAVTGEVTTGPESEIRICLSVPVGDVAVDL